MKLCARTCAHAFLLCRRPSVWQTEIAVSECSTTARNKQSLVGEEVVTFQLTEFGDSTFQGVPQRKACPVRSAIAPPIENSAISCIPHVQLFRALEVVCSFACQVSAGVIIVAAIIGAGMAPASVRSRSLHKSLPLC